VLYGGLVLLLLRIGDSTENRVFGGAVDLRGKGRKEKRARRQGFFLLLPGRNLPLLSLERGGGEKRERAHRARPFFVLNLLRLWRYWSILADVPRGKKKGKRERGKKSQQRGVRLLSLPSNISTTPNGGASTRISTALALEKKKSKDRGLTVHPRHGAAGACVKGKAGLVGFKKKKEDRSASSPSTAWWGRGEGRVVRHLLSSDGTAPDSLRPAPAGRRGKKRGGREITLPYPPLQRRQRISVKGPLPEITFPHNEVTWISSEERGKDGEESRL